MHLGCHRLVFNPRRAGWWLGFVFDGDDEQGDPSGLNVVICGVMFYAYWKMHRRLQIVWSLGQPFRVSRW